MTIGIDASRAFVKHRTGIEEYSYQVIRHLILLLKNDQVVLYVRKNYNLQLITNNQIGTLKLPENWKVKVIKWPYLWTQIGLSLEMLLHPVDVLFIPAHTVPIIHPLNTIVTIHGLEYEFCPQAYSFWARWYMRWSIKNSCHWAKKIIAVSNNTKQDLVRLYQVPEEKIRVIYEAYEDKSEIQNLKSEINSKLQIQSYKPYLMFIGRLEERKNIVGIIKAFEILKEQYKLPHKLILAGELGYGGKKIKEEIENVNCSRDIILPGYVREEEKWKLLKNADVFLFPTFYEGFGLPILEAQSAGVPVVAGNNSSIPEIIKLCHSKQGKESCFNNNGGKMAASFTYNQNDNSALLVDPQKAEQIADAAYELISNKSLRDDIIKRGYENVKRFNWKKCAEEIVTTLLDK